MKNKITVEIPKPSGAIPSILAMTATCEACGTEGSLDINISELTADGDILKGTLEFDHTCTSELEAFAASKKI